MSRPETFDLVLSRSVRATPAQIWTAWTTPEHLMQWWAPAPVTVPEARINPVPGGAFFTRMVLPDGSEHASEGCVLVAEPERRIVFTDGMRAGFQPNETLFMVADITIAPAPDGALYTAKVMHKSAEDRSRHSEMGFETGWGTALSQLEILARGL